MSPPVARERARATGVTAGRSQSSIIERSVREILPSGRRRSARRASSCWLMPLSVRQSVRG